MRIREKDFKGKFYEIIGFESPRLLMLNDKTTHEHYEVNYEQDYDKNQKKWGDIEKTVIDDPNTVDI